MPFDSKSRDEIERRNVAQRLKMVSVMSNAKWKRLFVSIELRKLNLPVCEWRFLRDERWFIWSTPKKSDIHESGTCDGHLQPFYFRDVEQVRWPKGYEAERSIRPEIAPCHGRQNLGGLERLMVELGGYDYTFDEAYLTLYAYRDP